jgi:citronellol/citronellal dehydrogenase
MSSGTPPLAGRTAIVTGASRGIGRATAIELARCGANVVVAARTTTEQPPWALGTIRDTVREIEQAGGRAIAVRTDVRRHEEVEAMAAAAVDTFGGIDVLVNSAGAFKMKPASSTTPREVQLVMDVNVVGAFACIASCLPHLRRSKHAHIVNIAPPPRAEPYWVAGKLLHAVSKLALTMMTLGLSEELRPAGIAVNAVWPKTVVATIGTQRIGGEALHRMARKPEIVAQAIAELVSCAPGERTGHCLLDEGILRAAGVEDFERFAVDPSMPLLTNYFVDPEPAGS